MDIDVNRNINDIYVFVVKRSYYKFYLRFCLIWGIWEFVLYLVDCIVYLKYIFWLFIWILEYCMDREKDEFLKFIKFKLFFILDNDGWSIRN